MKPTQISVAGVVVVVADIHDISVVGIVLMVG